MTELQLKTHSEPLPGSKEEVFELVKKVLELSSVEELRITPHEVVIRRHVRPAEEVMPQVEDEDDSLVDPDFLISRVEKVELPHDPSAHPYRQVYDAIDLISTRGLRATHVIAPTGEWFGAFLGLSEGSEPTSAFGLTVIYSASDICRQKFVVLGGPTHYITDARVGVLIDLGI